ncbi:MAG: hypothetical protein AAFV71_03060 [Cyanobacteria bacterium J06633_8]
MYLIIGNIGYVNRSIQVNISFSFFLSRKQTNRRFLNRQISSAPTSFNNFHLVQPLENKPNAIEIDDIQFETLVPEKVLIIPEKESEAETSVKIGIKITNNSQNPYRFDFYSTLIPQIIGVNGELLSKAGSSEQLRANTKSDYPLAMPGECVTRFPSAKLLWHCDQLKLKIATGYGGFYFFNSLQAGEYLIRFVYIKNNSFTTSDCRDKTNKIALEWIEKTIVSTSYVKFSLSKFHHQTVS